MDKTQVKLLPDFPRHHLITHTNFSNLPSTKLLTTHNNYPEITKIQEKVMFNECLDIR